MNKYELHPLCTLFPRLEGAEFQALCNDIAANGLRNPIVIHKGMILDGGNRYRACLEAGVEPSFQEFTGANLVSFVLSANLHRRHMSPGQQAAIVASAQDWAKAQQAYRPSEKPGNVAGLSTVADRAAQSGASERTQRMADKVAKSDPYLALQVAHGNISLPKAIESMSPQASTRKASQPDAESTIPEGKVLYDKDEIDELHNQVAELIKDNESMAKVFEADDKLAEAVKEACRLNALVTILEGRRDGLMNECNEAKRHARNWKHKFEKAEKELQQYKDQYDRTETL